MDYAEANVKVFDKTGEHKRTFGKKGEGPGELIMRCQISTTYKNELMLEDIISLRMNLFTLEGDFIKSLLNRASFFVTFQRSLDR